MISLVFTCLTTWHDKEEMVVTALNIGNGAVMGALTEKVVDYATKSKTCRVCCSGKGKKCGCRKNHTGSSKIMEPDVAVDLFKSLVMYITISTLEIMIL